MGNTERNSHVKKEITDATIRLLKNKELSEISISDIIAEASVSRNSFYRNYTDKEDILRQHVYTLLNAWDKEYKASGKDSNYEMYGSLFGHLKDNSDFYLLLQERSLLHLVLDYMLDQSNLEAQENNMWAYTISFIMHGTYGWILEWIRRGMPEAADEMAKMLAAYGIK